MKLFLKLLLRLVIFGILTAMTQIGGLVYLVSMLTYGRIDKAIGGRLARAATKVVAFGILYLASVFVIVPMVARPLGRVPLPMFETHNLQPANVITCLLNRNYVRPQLREVAYQVADKLNAKFPGARVNYLDANFPFINKFPLLPHLSHNDGRKLDLSFQYKDTQTGLLTNAVPSFIGYGICEEPRPGEENMPGYCARTGHWQYDLLRQLVSQTNKSDFAFDPVRTRFLVESFAAAPDIARIYIEPHLKTRLGLTSSKIKFHGCQAVRHDDHLHVQIR